MVSPSIVSQGSIVPKQQGWETALASVNRQVEDDFDNYLFEIGQTIGLIAPDKQFKDVKNPKTIAKKFTDRQITAAHAAAVTGLLSEIHEHSGRALLHRLWRTWIEGSWVNLIPKGLTLEQWHFTDYAELFIKTKSDGYRRDLALIVERVFAWVNVQRMVTEDGEVIDFAYLINLLTIPELKLMSQWMLEKPSREKVQGVLNSVATGKGSATELIHHERNAAIPKFDIYVENCGGDHAERVIHISVRGENEFNQLKKKLGKSLGEERLYHGASSPKYILQRKVRVKVGVK